jgi:uncharacterized protein
VIVYHKSFLTQSELGTIMTIVDTHTHLGGSYLMDEEYPEEWILGGMRQWGVGMSLVMPHSHGMPDAERAHDRVFAFVQQHKATCFGVADINPMLPEELYWKEATRCIKELGFVALKLHPLLHPCNPLAKSATKVFEAAKALGVPVISHTGLGSPFSLPSLLISRAREFPDLPIVMAHAGQNFYIAEAVIAAQVCDNLFLEPSWCGAHRVRDAIRALGSERFMWGSDSRFNIPVELTKYRTIGLSGKELEDCLGATAARVFRLPVA